MQQLTLANFTQTSRQTSRQINTDLQVDNAAINACTQTSRQFNTDLVGHAGSNKLTGDEPSESGVNVDLLQSRLRAAVVELNGGRSSVADPHPGPRTHHPAHRYPGLGVQLHHGLEGGGGGRVQRKVTDHPSPAVGN